METKTAELNNYTLEEIESARQGLLAQKAQHALYYQKNKVKVKVQQAQYYQKNMEEHKVRVHQNYQENGDKVSEHHAQYHQENREKVLKHVAQYYQEHKEEKGKYMTQYRQEHPEVVRNSAAKRKGAEGSFTSEEWTSKLSEFDNKCAYCGTKAGDTPEHFLTVDHAIPLTRSGANSIDNIVPSCLQCNMEKNTMTAEEFLDSIDSGKEGGVLVRRFLSEHPEEAAKLLQATGEVK